MIRLYKIRGNSMLPRFHAGDYLLLHKCSLVKDGDLIVYDHPSYGQIFKRVLIRSAEARQQPLDGMSFQLQSDHEEGLSPQQIGDCQPQRIRGKVLWHCHPKRLIP